MRSITRVLLLLLLLETETNAQEIVHKIEVKSIAGFTLSIYLPPDYSTKKEYKTLYFNDGQNVFGTNGLNVESIANELIEKRLIEPIVIIAIHSDQNRTSNYVPYPDESLKIDFGEFTPAAGRYTKRIVQQIIPYIENNYSVSRERGIAGYSFGGLHATWAALHYPEYFTFSGSLSPSYWVGDFKIFAEGSKAQKKQTYYFDVGTGEWNYYVPMLQHSNLTILNSIFYFEDFGGRHNLESWRGQRIKNILLLFAGNTNLTEYTWELQLEIIKSEANGKLYPRINPIIHYRNGLICSISYAAIFTVLNTADGVVNRDGSFRFTSSNDLNVEVFYNGEKKSLIIPFKAVDGK